MEFSPTTSTSDLVEETLLFQDFLGVDDLFQYIDEDIIGDFVGIEPLLLGNTDRIFHRGKVKKINTYLT